MIPEYCSECSWKDCRGCSVMNKAVKEAACKGDKEEQIDILSNDSGKKKTNKNKTKHKKENRKMGNRKNFEGYMDPTASKVFNEEHEADYRRFRKLLDAIYDMCDATGFAIEGRITLRDRTTGKVWR